MTRTTAATLCTLSAIGLFTLAALSSAPTPMLAQEQGGISVDQYRRLFPPSPQNVQVELKGGKATIKWQAPPAPPPGGVGYDPQVAAYNVYRVDGGLEQRRRIGQTKDRTFTDPEILNPGGARRYTVTAVQRSGIESGMPDAVELRAPTR